MDTSAITPFLKWPGGKRWLVSRYAELLPKTYGRYIEPFLGGASVFFYLKPRASILGDTNAELINFYRTLAWRRNELFRLLAEHQQKHCKRHYYAVRKATPKSSVERAARMLYLNRTCFNGMYRVNAAGEFNVPKGVKSSVLMATDDFEGASKLLRKAEIFVADFEVLIDGAKAGDLVFADPPYVVGHNNNGFIKYNESLFSWSDQQRLASSLIRAQERGVRVVATNAAHSNVEQLYKSRHFTCHHIERYSSISGKARGRCQFRELLVFANCD